MLTLPDDADPADARLWQDCFDSWSLADRLSEKLSRPELTAENCAFIARQPLFFLASANKSGQPDVSYRCGAPGFAQAPDARTLAFPNYDGNGRFGSLGKVLQNERVGLLLATMRSRV